MGLTSADIENLRENYKKCALLESEVGNSPFALFEQWFTEALEAKVPEPNAMTLATSNQQGDPSARIVLLKGFSEDGFIFYTNYESRKGIELEYRSKVALVFFWPMLERQIRIIGNTNKLTKENSEEYFSKRPKESQIGAIISPQSQIIPSREYLEEKFNDFLKLTETSTLKKPENWGGYKITPESFEFWQGRPGRLHDRLIFSKKTGVFWAIERLAP